MKLDFNPYSYELHEDPYPTYARLRDEDPFHYAAGHDLWVISRHEDLWQAQRDSGQTFSNAMGVTIDEGAWGPEAWKRMSFLAMDPPDQTKMRGRVAHGFTPRKVRALEDRVRQITAAHFDRFLGEVKPGQAVEVDWMELAGQVPMDVICEIFGVPQADRADLRRHSARLVHRDADLFGLPPEAIESGIHLAGYFSALLQDKRTHPQADLLSQLVQPDERGEAMTDEELIGFCFLMTVAGDETTLKLLGHCVWYAVGSPYFDGLMTTRPDDTAAFAAWAEESLRYDTSTQLVARHLLKDVTLHGKTAPAGAKVLLAFGSGNRDERVFTDPERYDITRSPAELARTLSFGGGRHFCLGVHLARMEAKVVLAELVRRVCDIELDRDAAERVHSVNVRGFASMPARLVTRA